MIEAVVERIRRAHAVAVRATVIPVLVRFAVLLCGMLGVLVACPAELVGSRLLAVLLAAAAVPAFAPRKRAGLLVAVLVVAGWIIDTTWYAQPVALWRLLAVATVLYLGHSLTALAAALPPDAVVRVDVVAGWLARALAVVLGSAVLMIVILAATAQLSGGAFLAATVVGLAAAVAAAAVLTSLLRRA